MTYSGSHEALCATAPANSPQKASKLSLLIGALRERPEGPDEGISRSRDCRETPSTTHRFAGATRTEKVTSPRPRADDHKNRRTSRGTANDAPAPPQVPECCEGSSRARRGRRGALRAQGAGTDQGAPAAIAAAAALAPAAALADVSFVEEVEGVALGLLPLAGIAAIVGGGAIAKLGPSLEKAAKMKRTLALEYSAQKRFLKKEMDVKA